MSVAIRVENLSKAYQIGQIGTGTISRDIERWFVTRVMGREDPFLKLGEVNDRTTKSESNVVWSLKDINLEIEQGDAVGIIGRNGAGKSTLLKLLSRVTAPTTGRIKIKGRVASLLEVGTGFHPELTGRENIYLNGSILGMRKKEIDRKLDEIVDFSGVERYIDTPVKRYSSGMSVRLAFAVAAHLESEILIVDEVLAVGDAEFQKKCLGKMEEVGRKEGRTVLFVSHNMSAVHALCKRAILIDSGQIKFEGSVVDCIAQYAGLNVINGEGIEGSPVHDRPAEIGGIRINNLLTANLNREDGFEISVDVTGKDCSSVSLICLIHNAAGHQIVHDRINLADIGIPRLEGSQKLRLVVPTLWLTPGVYSLFFKMLVADPGRSSRSESERITFEVSDEFEASNRGILLPEITWQKVLSETVRSATAVRDGISKHAL
jgi:ABC-type polysaccharide/polyol phosphate transport system ATPase subunit